MSRFLFIVPPLTGHINPTVSVAHALIASGHRVAWVGHASRVRPLLPPEAELLALDELDLTALEQRSRAVRGLESLQFLWEDVLIPLAHVMRPGVLRAIASWAPDVAVVDHQALAGAVAATETGVRWATFCTTSASVVDALAALPKVKAWVEAQVHGLFASAGLATASPESPSLVVVFSTRALVGHDLAFPAHYRFVGPATVARPDATPFPWERLSDALPRVFVSLGTVNAESGAPFYAAAVEALGDLRVILAAPPALVPSPPAHWIVQPRVPQLALLPHVSAVVCHGGHNTTCEALAHGLPLVLTPIRDDQPLVTQQVVRAGAGLRVRFGRVAPGSLREAVLQVLTEPSFREAARRLQSSFAEAGGAQAAAQALITLGDGS